MKVGWEISFATSCGDAGWKLAKCRSTVRAPTCWRRGRGMRRPEVFFSTHMDTVPPFIASSEDDERIYGRGACDAKGIIAAEILAAEKLRGAGVFVGLLFLVGEERDSIGARVANQQPMGARFMINGEPTENKLALASKGALHVELVAHGKMAHSAYPELGESAIDKLVEALHRLHAMKLPEGADVGACTKNVGLIQGGRAPNVIPDFAKASLFYRLVGPADALRREITETVGDARRGSLHARDSVSAVADAGRSADDGRGLHHRCPVPYELGRAVAARSGLDSRGAHGGRVCGESAVTGGGGDLLFDGEEAEFLAVSSRLLAQPISYPRTGFARDRAKKWRSVFSAEVSPFPG